MSAKKVCVTFRAMNVQSIDLLTMNRSIYFWVDRTEKQHNNTDWKLLND